MIQEQNIELGDRQIQNMEDSHVGDSMKRTDIGKNNTGKNNTGNYNVGDHNTGDHNAGHSNTGHLNSRNYNTGNYNTGDSNAGIYNAGNGNIGINNTGNQNIGDYNTGDQNIGDYNTGDHNTGDYNVGSFCRLSPPSRLFDKEVTDNQYTSFMRLIPAINITKWVSSGNMTDEEKRDHPDHETTGGYLKQISYKEAWKKAWDELDSENIDEIINHECFDAEAFDDITGLDTVTLLLEKAIIKGDKNEDT